MHGMLKTVMAGLLSVAILGSSAQSAHAGDLWKLRPSTPLQRDEHPVLEKLLVGVGLIGLGFAAGEAAAHNGWDQGQGGFGRDRGAYIRYNSQSGIEYGWNY